MRTVAEWTRLCGDFRRLLRGWIEVISLAFSAICATATGVYMFADRAGNLPAKRVAKMTAASGFVATAAVNGAMESDYGKALFVALLFSWLGDAALLSRASGAFIGGLFAFLIGHLAFGAAFVVRGVDWTWALAGAVALTAVVATAGKYFVAKAPEKMRWPVIAYITVIGCMGALAIGSIPSPHGQWIGLAAAMFVVSDVFVGRDRFVSPGFQTRRWGTPLYFGGQLLFAWTVAF